MRNLLILSILLFSTLAQAKCYEYELIGQGEMGEENIFFVIAPKTQSEVKLSIPLADQELLAPYINRVAKTRLIIDRNRLNHSTKVMKVVSINYEIPDPLNLSSTTSVKKMGEIKCPKS